MGAYRSLLGLLPLLVSLNAMSASAMFAKDTASHYPLRITVLSAETRTLNAEAQASRDCSLANYSAYCNQSGNPSSQSILLVQDADGKSYRITCTADSRSSKCVQLPPGKTFEARKEKHGFTILYQNTNGKEIRQFYQLVAAVPAPQFGAAAASQPHAAAPPQNLPAPAPAPAPQAVAPVQSSPAPAPAPPPVSAQGGVSPKVRCNFISTPSGAEITIDWRYVGNTPSEIGLSTGTHVIVVSMPGYDEWKRELTVAADSVVNVSANLQKTQP